MNFSQKILTVAVTAFAIASSQMIAAAEDAPQKIKFSGTVGLEGSYDKHEPEAGKDLESDGFSASADLGVDVTIDNNVTSFIGLTWEDNDEDSYSFEIDEAYFKLGGNDAIPL